MEDQIKVERVNNEEDLQKVFAIRRKVFVDEQNTTFFKFIKA